MSIQAHCEKIAGIIVDYRQGQIARPNGAHVARWTEQFPTHVREPLLSELAHVLGKSYVSENAVKGFIEAVISSENIAGADPAAFWRDVQFLRLQQAGNSQRDMLAIFDKVLSKICGLSISDCGKKPTDFVYLDDGVFSGGRVKSDLIRWIKDEAPKEAKVAVIAMVVHTLGEFFASKDIREAAQAAGKKIEVSWWRSLTAEDRKTYMTNSDVLRPKTIPVEAQAYMTSLGTDPVLRTGDQVGGLGLFSSSQGRDIIEQEFLKGGVRVRECCPHFNAFMRPLGSSLMKTAGFGTMFITHRNIANNAPLVLWAGDPWYPLFPRRTN